MDSDTSVSDKERPVPDVTIKNPFAIGAYEVTLEQYDAFVEATTGTKIPDDEAWGRANRPAISVSWVDVQGYVKWLSAVTGERYWLPTEAEWEYVARACKGPEPDCWSWNYWWGEEMQPGMGMGMGMGVCSGCESEWEGKADGSETARVYDPSFKANAFGLYHTADNVWEWVQDCWHANYTDAPKDGSAWEEEGGGECAQRVLRGGSWNNSPEYLRSAFRYGSDTFDRRLNAGFRLAQDF